MGARKDVLIEGPCPDLFCGLCQDLLDEPIQVRCPEDHIFCKRCITNYIEQNDVCPFCQTTIDPTQFQPSKFVMRQIGRLPVYCVYRNTGCSWQGLFYEDHSNQCEHQPADCPNKEQGCVDILRTMDLEHHKSQCTYELISCPNHMPGCTPFLRKDILIHERQCRSYPCTYAAEGCPFFGTLQERIAHEDTYCGKLHSRLLQLEQECEQLKKLLSEQRVSQNTLLQSAPSMLQSSDEQIRPESIQNDSTMADLDLLHQVLNNDAFPAMSFLNNTNSSTTNSTNNNNTNDTNNNINNINSIKTTNIDTTTHPIHTNEFMDFSISLPGFAFPTNLTTSPPIPAPTQLAASSAPKRSSNGKRIRYSKNVRLAHSALRIARQQGTYHENNPDNLHTGDAILQGLDIAGSASGQRVDKSLLATQSNVELKDLLTQQQGHLPNVSSAPLSGHQFPLYDLDEMAKFLSEMPMPADSNIPKPCLESAVVEKTVPNPSQLTNASTAKSRKDDTGSTSGTSTTTRKKKASAKDRKKEEPEQSLPRSPPNPGSPNNHASPPSTAAPKRRPMFVLASSYLTNYK